ncbi:MAG: RNA polymerase sigma factor [Flavobacteriales bacterium]|nr:RNA polymerase sigma factor [Flavobacteriia bacterium]NCP06282.1 RNA polymerase sigma factor [Flavobacteriales bacterium]PIV95135.1 MAG: RNA polymerase subunit sigma-70 [Flavobacteriaceae bacterium CG17_big_fil_post_rev_8_21_14_2_50_33_15]PIY13398.1 MAG: RNA polymerase subunit sigma-70 [Flavobacteriaceae bacterium CG_4_10_14_3_um_filter_33_47]PJB19725.1 MAG: RNA polymerase subunit sigma-70 [Flavobacteriaceae bacterium CG_4_9_14_3_um_filter_33_16]
MILQKDLIENICQEQVFERIYNKYAKDLHDFLYYKYGEQFNPNDKAQDAFVKLWDNCKNVTLSKAKSFLFTVANNMVLNDIKHQKVVLNYQKEIPKDYTNETPEFILEKEQFLQRYQKVLGSLTEEQRVAFLLNKVEGKKHSEIAELLGITQKVVEYRIYTAFNILKKELEGFKIK